MKKITCLICLGLMMGLLTSAQDDLIADPFTSSDPGSGLLEDPAGTENGNPGNIPVDGGLSLLLAAGAAYGVKRVWGRREVK